MELLTCDDSDRCGPIGKSIDIPYDEASLKRYFADGRATKTGYGGCIRLRTSMPVYTMKRKPRLFEYLTKWKIYAQPQKSISTRITGPAMCLFAHPRCTDRDELVRTLEMRLGYGPNEIDLELRRRNQSFGTVKRMPCVTES